jgi:phosphoglycolate phosphatase
VTILLDLDGTLTDPSEGITRCIQHALRQLDEPVPEQQALLKYIGPPLQASFTQMLGGEARVAAAMAAYRERFADVGLYENVLYPRVREVLQTLIEQGERLILATSKPHVYAQRIVEHFQLEPYLEALYGSELDGTRTDKRELLGYLLEQQRLDGAECTMVGDRKHDAIGARANGVAAVGVLWGFGSREELTSAGVASLLRSPDDLLGLAG